MDAKRWVIGALLGMAGVSSAAAGIAVTAVTADASGGRASSTADSSPESDSGAAISGLPGGTHAAPQNHAPASRHPPSADNALPGAGDRPPLGHGDLGWQSLLPGSIQ